MTAKDAFQWAAALSAELFAGDEAREGMAAFLQKRARLGGVGRGLRAGERGASVHVFAATTSQQRPVFPQVEDCPRARRSTRCSSRSPTGTSSTETQFKGYTIGDVVGHLHHWNAAADLSLRDGAGFQAFFKQVAEGLGGGLDAAPDRERVARRPARPRAARRVAALLPRDGGALRRRRPEGAGAVGRPGHERALEHHRAADGDLGPRAGGLRRARRRARERRPHPEHRGARREHLRLDLREPQARAAEATSPTCGSSSPSGAIWEWNAPSEASRVEGDATEFCQVVTQVRSLGDTKLRVTGETARALDVDRAVLRRAGRRPAQARHPLPAAAAGLSRGGTPRPPRR